MKYILGPDNEVHVTVRAIFGALGWLLLWLGFGPWGGLPMKRGEPGHDDKDEFEYQFKFKKIYLSLLLLPGLDWELGHHYEDILEFKRYINQSTMMTIYLNSKDEFELTRYLSPTFTPTLIGSYLGVFHSKLNERHVTNER